MGGQSFLDHHAHFHSEDDGPDHHHHHHDSDPLGVPERNTVTSYLGAMRQQRPDFLQGFSDAEVIALVEIRRGATATVAYQDLSAALTQLAVRSGFAEQSLIHLSPTANDALVINGLMSELHDSVHHAADAIDAKRSRSAMLREVLFSVATGFFDLLYNHLPTWLFGPKSRPVMRSTRVANFFFHWFPFIPGAATGALGFLKCPQFQPTVTADQLCVAAGELAGVPVAYHTAFHESYFAEAKNQSLYINLQGPSESASIVERFELTPAHENDRLIWRYRSPSCDEQSSTETCHELEARGVSIRDILRESSDLSEDAIQALPQEYRLQISHRYSGEFVEQTNENMVSECLEIPGSEDLERDCSPFSQGHVCIPGTPSAEQCCNYCHALPGVGGHCH